MGKRGKKTAVSAADISNARRCSDVEYPRILESPIEVGRKYLGIMVLSWKVLGSWSLYYTFLFVMGYCREYSQGYLPLFYVRMLWESRGSYDRREILLGFTPFML